MQKLHIDFYAKFAYNVQGVNYMYKKMYFKLFNIVTDALEEKDINAVKELLRNGQIETEEMYINGNED